jgi:energy-coupling factor transporter ATP-binding protein EcfA2
MDIKMNIGNAKLTLISLERFKSFNAETRIELAPLTVVVGRNNSGKSTLIQGLLLLKQTLADPRPDVMLRLEGMLDAFGLREITFGRPSQAPIVEGPVIALEWESEVDVKAALSDALSPDLTNLTKHSGVAWLKDPPDRKTLKTSIKLNTREVDGAAEIGSIELKSLDGANSPTIHIIKKDGSWSCSWRGKVATQIQVELDHFIPYLKINRSAVSPRDRQRAWHNAYAVLFAQPLDALKSLLAEMHYLGSFRQPPPSLFKSATTAPSGIGVSGEFAAQLLHRRQRDVVHFLPPVGVADSSVEITDTVYARPLVEAVNYILEALSVKAPLRVEEIADVGFRLLFGDASLLHVGRGLSYLLPLVELGLFADPLRFSGSSEDMSLSDYCARCNSFTHIALEEPEAHLHPKVASRLAHWLVSLARANRRLIVETHSDHLVRRLRGLVARANSGSELEQWLLQNVVVLSVEQDSDGNSSVTSSRLTSDGGVTEIWPADFMDESTDEESAIYYAKLNKSDVPSDTFPKIEMVEGEEPEVDEAP